MLNYGKQAPTVCSFLCSQATADNIQAQTDLLVGDVFLSAACIAYYGAFTGAYRQDLVDAWINECKDRQIPVSSDASLKGTLGSPVEVRCSLTIYSFLFSCYGGPLVCRHHVYSYMHPSESRVVGHEGT